MRTYMAYVYTNALLRTSHIVVNTNILVIMLFRSIEKEERGKEVKFHWGINLLSSIVQ